MCTNLKIEVFMQSFTDSNNRFVQMTDEIKQILLLIEMLADDKQASALLKVIGLNQVLNGNRNIDSPEMREFVGDKISEREMDREKLAALDLIKRFMDF